MSAKSIKALYRLYPTPIDLAWHIQRGVEWFERWVAPMQEKDPVEIIAKGDDHYRHWELSHNVGRAIDGLCKGAEATGRDPDAPTLQTLTAVLYASLDNDLGLPSVYSRDWEQMVWQAHDVREAMQALLCLSARGSDEAYTRLGRILDLWLSLTDDDGAWIPERIAKHPPLADLAHPDYLDDGTEPSDAIWPRLQAPPTNRGRAIMALTQIYRRLGDPRALELAARFVRLVRTRSFRADGQLTVMAGGHTHSITGTVHGLADYGLLTGDADTLGHASRILDNGLPATGSSFGWSFEGRLQQKIFGRGEINNTGDMIQAALFLGEAGYPRYFEVAERMLRSHILPSQWLDGHSVTPGDDPPEGVHQLRDKDQGGWGFPGVNDRHVPRAGAAVTDIVQGGIQCLWALARTIVTAAGPATGTRVNLLLTGGAEGITVTSELPDVGHIAITSAKPQVLWVRVPSWLETQSLAATTGGEALAWRSIGDWLVTAEPVAALALRFSVPRRTEDEWVNNARYRMVYEGDTIVAMDPQGRYAPMYPSIAELER